MQLPGQLKDTTLGDLLGALHRDRATGFLELVEPSQRMHRIELWDGKVQSVETEAPGPRLGDLLDITELPIPEEGRLGETLIARGLVSHFQLEKALHRQTLARLELLFGIDEAAIRFRAPRPRADDPTIPRPLETDEFLGGRPRKRGDAVTSELVRQSSSALRVLGLCDGAKAADIRRAFRELAGKHHPDRHPGLSAAERARLFRRFAEISRAYHALTG